MRTSETAVQNTGKMCIRDRLIFYCLAGTTLVREVRMVFKAVDRSLEEGRMQVARIVAVSYTHLAVAHQYPHVGREGDPSGEVRSVDVYKRQLQCRGSHLLRRECRRITPYDTCHLHPPFLQGTVHQMCIRDRPYMMYWKSWRTAPSFPKNTKRMYL